MYKTMVRCRYASFILVMVASCQALVAQSTTKRNRSFVWSHTGDGPMTDDSSNNDVVPVKTVPSDEALNFVIPSPTVSLEQLLSPVSSCDVTQLGPTTLAYVGDVVFELFVRSRMIWPTRRTSDLQEQVVSLVRGESLHRLQTTGRCYGLRTTTN